MFVKWILLGFVATAYYQPTQGQIPYTQEYAATAVPRNPSSVRSALGYNKYDEKAVKDTDKTVIYGNNWELFDHTNDANQDQARYVRPNQQHLPYRYYRAIYY